MNPILKDNPRRRIGVSGELKYYKNMGIGVFRMKLKKHKFFAGFP